MDGEVVEDLSGHTTGHMSGRVQVIARVSGRRIFTVDQKLAILRDAFGPDGSVRGACERHEVSSGQVYTWRKNAMSGQLGMVRPATPALAPVFAEPIFAEPVFAEPIFAEVAVAAPPLLPLPAADVTGHIAIELPSGIRLRVDAGVDGDALARVLSVLGQ